MPATTLPATTLSVCAPEKGPELVLVPALGFAMQRTEITRADFAVFVKATGYITLAERPDPDAPGKTMGSAVFQTPRMDRPQWWELDHTANWRTPRGSTGETQTFAENLPVVQITYPDALAYAEWVGGRLPTRQEFQAAALGGEAWSDSTAPPDSANTWQGAFPVINTREDGFVGLAPVASFPANPFGLHDTVGNAWEWTSTAAGDGQLWLAGGSFLCDVNICRNGTPFGSQMQDVDFSADHIGFRLVFDTLPDGCEEMAR